MCVWVTIHVYVGERIQWHTARDNQNWDNNELKSY